MQTKATSVAQYLASLPADRRAAISAVRDVIRANLDPSYEEGIQYGMIGYYVPHTLYPAGYHTDPKQPLPFAALASQKNHMALYLMGIYCDCAAGKEGETPDAQWFRDAWASTGKKLDMGKVCVRFQKLENLPLDVIGEAMRRIPAKAYIARYEAVGASAKGEKSPKRAKPTKTAARKKGVA
jgi:hypothetical protein